MDCTIFALVVFTLIAGAGVVSVMAVWCAFKEVREMKDLESKLWRADYLDITHK